jgi:acyl-CoA reductase-like NAD-dependent aldehyde dehydrogenase
LIGIFPESTREDVKKAIKSAVKHREPWSTVPIMERAEIIGKFGNLLKEEKESLAEIITRENGKPLREARGEVQEGIDTALFALNEAKNNFGVTVPSELSNKFAYTTVNPVGTVGIITPWNFPVAIPCWKLIPALLIGNTVVFKPSPQAPASATRVIELLLQAGVPDGVINMIHGAEKTVVEEIVENLGVKVISFTGSTEVGRKIAEIAGRNLKKVGLELGGKNPQIVLEDADLGNAVEGAVWGAFATTGQRCTSTSRLLLQENIYDKFLKLFLQRVKKLKTGNGLDKETEIGPIINERRLNTILKYIENGKDEGAELLLGGKRISGGKYDRGYFLEPTIFTNVDSNMKIAQEEILGPVLAVIRICDFEEGIEIANDVDYGLSASLYTKNLDLAMEAVGKLETGMVYVNAPTIGAECHMPFGGVKSSGNGFREGGKWAYELYGEIKAVTIDYSGDLQKAQIDRFKNKKKS